MINPFAAPGEWLRGNLHCHSTESDGEPSPQQIVDIYADRGYDFLAITDHRKLTDVTVLEARGLTLIPGTEFNGGRGELGQQFHLVLVGQHQPVDLAADQPIQELIDQARAAGDVCWIAHPSWSSLTFADLLGLQGIIGIEAYNTTCHHGIGRGASFVQWDELLARGQRTLGLAVDDAHWHYDDAIGGWIVVRSPSRAAEDIVAAIGAGLFYGSTGPVIEDVNIDGRAVQITCPPACEVRLINPMPGTGWTTFRQQRPGPFTRVEWTIPPAWTMFRIEISDERGRMAWTNPFYLD